MKIVKYTQENCNPCKMLEMFLSNAELAVDESVKLGIDIDFEVARDEIGISSTPTIILFDDNDVEVERVSGTNFSAVQKLFNKAN